jgi:hypothetical protein
MSNEIRILPLGLEGSLPRIRDYLSAGVEMSTSVWMTDGLNRFEPEREISYFVSNENPSSTILPRDWPLSISA